MKSVFCGLTLVFLASTGISAYSVSPHAEKAVEAIRQLRAIGLPNSDDLETAPPPKVPGLLRTLNKELKNDLNNNSRHTIPSEEEILEDLTAAGWVETNQV